MILARDLVLFVETLPVDITMGCPPVKPAKHFSKEQFKVIINLKQTQRKHPRLIFYFLKIFFIK